MESKQYEVVLIPREAAGFIVSVPELPEGYLATMREHGWKLPSVRREQVAVNG